MREYSCIIIDDEQQAIDLLSDTLCELHPEIKVLGTYTKWQEALAALRREVYDIILLDISMPEKSGFDLLSYLPNIESEIIFVTAHTKFAIDAFNYPATGYLLKPVDDMALCKTINKAIARIDTRLSIATSNSHKIALPNNRGIDYVEASDIFYFEAITKNTRIKTLRGEYMSTQSFGVFRETLPYPPFYQIHRSFIVNVNCIQRYENTRVIVLANGDSLPISKNLHDDFLKKFRKKI